LLTGCSKLYDSEVNLARLESLPRYKQHASSRLYAEHVSNFIPSGNYGTVYPYLGQINHLDKDTYWWGSSISLYGFATADGSIICDPVYDSVSAITYGDKLAYVASRTVDPNRLWGLDHNLNGNITAVMSADGSFYSEFDSVYITNPLILPFEYEYIPVQKNGKWGVIDFDGTEILPCVYPNAPLFSEGFAAVYEDNEELETLTDDYNANTPYYYINVTGEIVLGPYERPMWVGERYLFDFDLYDLNLEAAVFHNGRAMNFNGYHYGFIDVAGELVIPQKYTLIGRNQFGWNEHGLAFVCVAEVTETQAEWDLDYTYYLYGKDGIVTYALIDVYDNRIAEWTCPPSAFPYGEGGYIVVRDGYWQISALFDVAGNTLPLPILDADYFFNGYFLKMTSDVDTTEWYFSGNGISRTVKADSAQWFYGDWFILSSFGYENVEYRRLNLQTGEEFHSTEAFFASARDENRIIIHDGMNYGVISSAGEEIIEPAFRVLEPIGDNYFAVSGKYSGLVSDCGEWIVKTLLIRNAD
jgi:hypothetical protein